MLRLPYPPFWQNTAESYTIALKSTARAVIVGDIAILVGQFLNAYLITKWKILVRGRYFWLRSVGSSIVGDTITVSLAILGIFGGRMSTDALLTTLIPELVIMVFFTALGAFPASIIAKILAKAENLNNFDIGVNFNPFKLDASN
ncbi:MAG: hypothetical protein ACD_29C00032G0004 [uncultured bacterium]|nr:MAG: hypothetical protein ACD_29C00032G0004 [uncultured bacterium]